MNIPRCLGIALSVFLAAGSRAATISLTADQPSYNVGDTITLTIIGDSEGSTANGIFGRLIYDPVLADTLSATQQTAGAGWISGSLATGDGYAEVWNQIAFDAQSAYAVSTVQIVPQYGGTLEIGWETKATGFELNFFGATGPTLALAIAGDPFVPEPPPDSTAIPEPSAALVFAMGLVVLRLRRGTPVA